MSTDTVTIGCRLPAGYVLEVGLKTTARNGDKTVTLIQKGEGYRRINLKGTHEHTRHMRTSTFRPPAQLNAKPFINRGVPKDVWEQWKKEHARAWVLISKNLFEVPNGTDEVNVEAALLDVEKLPRVLEPIDPQNPGVGNVTPADFQADNERAMKERG